MQSLSNGILLRTVLDHPLPASPERPEDMGPSRSCLSLLGPHLVPLMSLMLLAGLAGCGPASSDNAPNLGARASAGGPPQSQQSPLPRKDPFTPAAITPTASPLPPASENGTGSMSGKGSVPGGNSPSAAPVPSSNPTDPVDTLDVPAWIAKDLDSPDIGTRLRALEAWVQSAPPGAIDPLILAYENNDERVRARAMELIEQDWARAADAGK